MSTNLHNKSSELFFKNENNNSWPDVGQDRPEQNSPEYLIRSGEILSPRKTSIDKNNDCVVKPERGALVRGSDPPSGHSVHSTARDKWRAPARRLMQKHLATGVLKTDDKNSRSLSDGHKIDLFLGLGEERRTPRETSRPLDHGSTCYLRGRHVHSSALPDTKRFGHGLILCRDRRSIVACSRVTE